MSYVAGIDISTKAIDVVLLSEDDSGDYFRHKLTGATAFDCARDVRRALPRGTFWDDVCLVVIEQAFSVSFRSAVALARVQGAVAALVPPDLAMFEMQPGEWQKVFLGEEKLGRDRKARKAAIKRRCIELGWGDAPDLPSDFYDAFAIAWSGRELTYRASEKTAAVPLRG